MALHQHALAPLLHAVDAWCQQRSGSEVAPRILRPSCARLCATVHCGAANAAASRLAELLRVLELLTRPGIDPQALHRLRHSSTSECNMRQQWCSYCDGVDRRVALRLSPPTSLAQSHNVFLAVVRAALFDWDESTASPEFLELRSQALSIAKGAERLWPVKLEINVGALESPALDDDLESLLRQLTRANGMLFEFELYQGAYASRRAMALIAASRLPIEVCAFELWRSVSGGDDDGNDDDNDDVALLAGANTTTLVTRESWEDPRLDRLMEALRTRSPQLKRLCLSLSLPESGEDPSRDKRREDVVQKIGQALFDIDSSLRLDELVLNAPICQRDLELLARSTTLSDVQSKQRAATFRHRSIELAQLELSQIQGASLGHLLASSGGVQSLRLLSRDSAFKIAEIPALLRRCPTLRELRATISCSGWNVTPTDGGDVSIETLELSISDGDPSQIARGIENLLRAVGHSLKSLSILLHNRHTTLCASLATVIAQQCPRLEQLHAHNPQRGFVSNLLDVYTTQPCKLRCLSLVTGSSNEQYDGLISALSNVAHPVAQELRSLRLDVCGWWDADAVAALENGVTSMLKLNTRLHDVTLAANFTDIEYYTEEGVLDDEEVERACGWTSTLAPLRHRLATLSALSRLCLPQGVLASILTMAGRRTTRYRRQDKLADTDERDSFNDDDAGDIDDYGVDDEDGD